MTFLTNVLKFVRDAVTMNYVDIADIPFLEKKFLLIQKHQ